MVVYNVALVEAEIDDHITLSAMTKYPTFYKYGQLYYKMDQSTGSMYLKDDGLLGVPGEIHGNPLFTEVCFALDIWIFYNLGIFCAYIQFIDVVISNVV